MTAASKVSLSLFYEACMTYLVTGCSPVHSLAFAKTHKSGSTTIQNLILRYGYTRDLTFALPLKGWMFNQTTKFNATTLVRHYARNPGHMFNFFASHSRWNIKG